MILGMDWLEDFSPMLCDWSAKWMEFSHAGHTIRLQGILPMGVSDIATV
jgi:hypothetical protein